MPLELADSVAEVVVQKNSYKVLSHQVINDSLSLTIEYVEGNYQNGVFKPIGKPRLISITDEEFMAMLGRNPTLYGTLKGVLYAELMLALGVSGNVV